MTKTSRVKSRVTFKNGITHMNHNNLLVPVDFNERLYNALFIDLLETHDYNERQALIIDATLHFDEEESNWYCGAVWSVEVLSYPH